MLNIPVCVFAPGIEAEGSVKVQRTRIGLVLERAVSCDDGVDRDRLLAQLMWG